MKKNNQPNIPLGLGMALSQNMNAMNGFAAMDADKQNQVISGAQNVRSKQEMQQYVKQLAENRSNFL